MATDTTTNTNTSATATPGVTPAPTGSWTEGKVVNGTNVGGGTFVPNTSSTPPISADGLNGKTANPVTLPVTTKTITPPPVVSAPTGTITDKNGNTAVDTTSSTSTQSGIKSLLASLGSQLSGKSAFTEKVQNDVQLADKTANATSAYNAYTKAQQDYNNQLQQLKDSNPTGEFGGAHAAEVAKFEREGSANVANYAILAQVAQGQLSAAEKTVQDKVNAQFQPIADQIDFLTKFSTVNNNDLTDSQKYELQAKADKQKTDSAIVQDAVTKIHDSLLKNGASPAAYSAVDKITHDYVDGKIDSNTATSQMYAAASKYGVSANTGYTIGANPIVDSHIANVLNGNETMAQVPANLRNEVSLGLTQQPTSSYSPLAASRFTTASSRITKQFTEMPAYSLTAGGQVYLDRINAARETPGSVSDQDLLDSLTKLNTGGNAVTDAQVKLVTDGKSFADAANVFANKLKNGGVLSDSQRTQLTSIANAIFKNYQKTYEPIYKQAAAQLTAAGIPKAFWTIPDLNTLSVNRDAGGSQTVQSNGQTYTVGQVYSDGTANWTIDTNGKWTKQ